MLFYAERRAHAGAFAIYFDQLPIPRSQRTLAVARFLGVTPNTVHAWVTGKREAPPAATIALFHESSAGRTEIDDHLRQAATNYRRLSESRLRQINGLLKRIEGLEQDLQEARRSAGHAVAANACAFDIMGHAVAPRRQLMMSQLP